MGQPYGGWCDCEGGVKLEHYTEGAKGETDCDDAYEHPSTPPTAHRQLLSEKGPSSLMTGLLPEGGLASGKRPPQFSITANKIVEVRA